jgi:hypothetical protein
VFDSEKTEDVPPKNEGEKKPKKRKREKKAKRISSSKEPSVEVKKETDRTSSEKRPSSKTGKPKMDPSVKILTIKAGRDTKLQKKSKRYRFGPKKGELMTPSDESIDEMLINTSDWSETSDEPLELKG